MKKTILFALMSAVATGLQAEVIQLSDTWRMYGIDQSISGESASGYTHTVAASTNANRAAYQSAALGDFSSRTVGIGETVQLSFTVTIDATEPLNVLTAEGLRWSVYDLDSGDGFSAAVDYGTTANTQVGRVSPYREFDVDTSPYVRIGSKTETRGQVNLQTSSTPGLVAQGSSSDFLLSITKLDANEYTYAFTYDDITISRSNFVDSTLLFNKVDAVGIRLNSSDANKFEVSNLELSVIPEPATFGLIGVVGAGLIGIRRIFLI